jgi:hypothetical protein
LAYVRLSSLTYANVEVTDTLVTLEGRSYTIGHTTNLPAASEVARSMWSLRFRRANSAWLWRGGSFHFVLGLLRFLFLFTHVFVSHHDLHWFLGGWKRRANFAKPTSIRIKGAHPILFDRRRVASEK